MKNKMNWAIRRLTLKIPRSALVLEVGSGGNPYPRSNVLLDAYEETRERHWESLIHDRPTVLSFGENLPFKDKAFDYVIAAHVLEHTPYPEKFLSELQRVAKSGFIETPDAFMERINPYKDHRLEVTLRDNTLIIRKKKGWINDNELVELYENRAKSIITSETIPQHPVEFHMRYFWKDKIDFKVLNPEVDAAWEPPSIDNINETPALGFKARLRLAVLSVIRNLFSQGKRNSKLDIQPLMRCPQCYSGEMVKLSATNIGCQKCNSQFEVDRTIYHMH